MSFKEQPFNDEICRLSQNKKSDSVRNRFTIIKLKEIYFLYKIRVLKTQ